MIRCFSLSLFLSLTFPGGHFVACFQRETVDFVGGIIHSRKRRRKRRRESTRPRDYAACPFSSHTCRRFSSQAANRAGRRISIRGRQIRRTARRYADKCNEYGDFHHLSSSLGANASAAILEAKRYARMRHDLATLRNVIEIDS